MTEDHIIDAVAQAIPLGYTQVWILEWVRAMRPELGQKIIPAHAYCCVPPYTSGPNASIQPLPTSQRRFSGTLAMTCPSTAHQLFLDLQRVERLAVVIEPPACLLRVWREPTGLVTHTSLIGEYGPVTDIHDGGQGHS
jgi:hypothetical protein